MTAACAAIDLEPIADAITALGFFALLAICVWVFFR